LVLIGLSAVIAICRLHSYNEPVDIDIGQYSVIAHEMLNGKRLYTDLFDQKPPALYCTYAVVESVTGYGLQSIYTVGLLTAIITLLGVYAVGSAGGVRGGLWSAVFWVILSGDCLMFAHRPMAEAFVSAAFIGAFAILVRPTLYSGRSRAIMVGLLLALGTLYKHNVVLVIPFLAIAHVLFPSDGRKHALQDVTWWAIIGLTAWGLVFGYFFVRGRFADFYTAIFTFNQWYAGRTWAQPIIPTLIDKVYHIFRPPTKLSFTMPLFVLTALGLALNLRRRHFLFIAFAVGYSVVIMATGFYEQYYAVFLPLLAIGAGWGLAELGVVTNTFAPRFPVVIGTVVVVFLAGYELQFYQIPGKDWARLRLSMSIHDEAQSLATEINRLLEPTETFYVWGDETSLYFYTKRPIPTRYHWNSCYINTVLSGTAPSLVIADLERTQPSLLVVCAWRPAIETNNAVFQWLSTRYKMIPGNYSKSSYRLAMLNGSKLESRLQAAAGQTTIQLPATIGTARQGN